MKYLIIAAIVVAVRIIIYFIKKEKKDVTVPEVEIEADEKEVQRDKKGVTMLGLEIAAADEKEAQRIAEGNYKPSPLPAYDYRRWKDEQSLINPVENELDGSIIQLCSEFTIADEAKRNEIRKSLSRDDIYTLIEFAKRATVFAIRKNEAVYLQHGFTAVAMIEKERCDFRDVWWALSFLDYGLKRLNIDRQNIYEKTQPLAAAQTAALIKSFSEQALNNNSLKGPWGCAEVETPYGTGFVSTYGRKYNPQKNLLKMLFEIDDYITNDTYRTGSITIGTEIAVIWFGADKDKNIEELNKKNNGCASLNSTLKEGLDSNSSYQRLDVWLSEFNDLNTLDILVGISNNDEPSGFSRLCFAEGDVLCMVIQRAIMQGVNEYETNESLKRFEDDFRKIITENSK